jgi:hypothetical protein
MRRFATSQPVTPGLVIEMPRQGYRVERVLMDEPGWALCEMAKTRGTYAGNLITAEITKEAT